MAANTAEDVYELVTQLPARERLRLVEKIAHDLLAPPPPEVARFEWAQLAGIASGLLGGQDAQEWVQESRHASDQGRDVGVNRRS